MEKEKEMERRLVAVTIMLNELHEVVEEYFARRRQWSNAMEATWLGEDQVFVDGVSAALRLTIDLACRELDHPALKGMRRPYDILPESVANGGQHETRS